MTLLELAAECTRVRLVREQCGLDPDTAHVVLVVPGRIGRGFRKRVAPGLYGRAVGETENNAVLIDCDVLDVERWLQKAHSS